MSKIQINAVVMLFLVSLWFMAVNHVQPYGSPVKIEERFTAIPAQFQGWTTRSSEVQSKVSGLNTASSLDRVYSNSAGDVVVLTIVYAASMSDLHQPEGCLTAQGWSTADQHIVKLRPQGEPAFEAMVNRQSHEHSGENQAIIYWFGSKNGNSRLLSTHKMKVYFGSIRERSSKSSALVRIMAPTSGDGDRAETIAKDFAEAASPYISAMLRATPTFRKL